MKHIASNASIASWTALLIRRRLALARTAAPRLAMARAKKEFNICLDDLCRLMPLALLRPPPPRKVTENPAFREKVADSTDHPSMSARDQHTSLNRPANTRRASSHRRDRDEHGCAQPSPAAGGSTRTSALIVGDVIQRNDGIGAEEGSRL